MNIFKLPIGDWSEDGHSICDWFDVTTEKSMKDVFDAYHQAVSLHPDINPGDICGLYHDDSIDPDVLEKIVDLGFKGFTKKKYIDTDVFAQFVVWYINLGDKDLKLKLVGDNKKKDCLISWNDPNRDFPNFGYGLFSD